jgi:hypothetical protein
MCRHDFHFEYMSEYLLFTDRVFSSDNLEWIVYLNLALQVAFKLSNG